jgi:hypothetical protein
MPYFTFPLSADGPVVQGLIGLNGFRTDLLVRAGQPVPRPVSVRALLDTGCDMTAIAPAVFQSLGLTPLYGTRTQTAGGSVNVNLYIVSLSVLSPSGSAGLFLVRPNLVVTELTAPLQNIDVLIGTDILNDCLFILNGRAGQFILGD